MHKRAIISFIIVLAIMGGLMLRIYDLSGRSLRQAAERQAGLTVVVANTRGTIYDSHLRPFVNGETEYRVSVTQNPKAVAALADCVDSAVLDDLTSRLQQGKPVVSAVDTLPSPAEGLTIYKTPIRYSGNLLAPHVVGYLDGDGIAGATGAELMFDELLSQSAGKLTVTYTVDAVGRPLEGIAPVISDTLNQSKAGVILTIDMDIQKIAETVAKKYITKGAVVVMEPKTGRIAAMVSLPDFQPDTLAAALKNPDSPLINRALSNYNCGSVFKIVTACTALEANIPVNTKFGCSGCIEIGGIKFHCHNRLGHGTLALPDAFAQSCNPYFIQLALLAGGSALGNMSVALGFDRPIFLAEGWKTARAVLPSDTELISPAAVGNLAFGQGSLMASPVHISQLVAAVVNDGDIIRPTLQKGTIDADGVVTEIPPAPAQTIFSKKTANMLRQLMIYAVENGTGLSARPFDDGAGGKTGTAETGIKINDKTILQGWFAGFYPAENPEYVITVLAEDTAGTGGKAAPVFKYIGEELAMLKKSREIRADDRW
ncbi:MAG: penicillin-binding protein 2 [Oscillospiraceae bacterium]|nr:penicillin-binding protein 2 [Oscillospiraceae bacterium]MDD4414408.1 penicillin-binding protein 2 [Oscillospiraceae bacterium]